MSVSLSFLKHLILIPFSTFILLFSHLYGLKTLKQCFQKIWSACHIIADYHQIFTFVATKIITKWLSVVLWRNWMSVIVVGCICDRLYEILGIMFFFYQIFNALLKVLENNFQLPPHHHLWSPPLHHFLVLLFITKFELTRVRGITRSAGRWLERCSAVVLLIDVRTNRVIAQDVKSCTYCCYVRCATLIVRVRRMLWPQTDD